MGQCKYCGKKGFFLSIDKDGLCKNCAPVLLMQVQQSIRVIKESENIINRTKCIDTRISRCDTILIHLKRLIEIERKGIPTLNIPPSKLFEKVTNERNKIKSESKIVDSGSCKYLEDYMKAEHETKQSGLINGKQTWEYVEKVKQLKREKRHHEAINLLLTLIDAVEREAKAYRSHGTNWFTAPGYYEQLAIIYRKEKRYSDEIAILERLQKQNNYLHESAMNRLVKARELQKNWPKGKQPTVAQRRAGK